MSEAGVPAGPPRPSPAPPSSSAASVSCLQGLPPVLVQLPSTLRASPPGPAVLPAILPPPLSQGVLAQVPPLLLGQHGLAQHGQPPPSPRASLRGDPRMPPRSRDGREPDGSQGQRAQRCGAWPGPSISDSQ